MFLNFAQKETGAKVVFVGSIFRDLVAVSEKFPRYLDYILLIKPSEQIYFKISNLGAGRR